MINAPCKDCRERNLGCHSSCERYAAYKAENDKLRAARMKENMLEGAQIEGVLRRKEAYRRGSLAHTENYINAKYRGRK